MKLLSIFCTVLVFISLFSLNGYALSDTAASSIIINADTLEVIYENNSNDRRSMASTTKIMTGLLLAESERLDEIVTCTKQAVTVEGSAMGLKPGDRISARDLLYGLMLQSGNDAANVIAHFLSGGATEFALLMNQKAKEIGMKNTNFVTPSGLDDEDHYTTAYDMAILAAYALKNEEFKKVCSSYTATVSFGNPMQEFYIKNHNRLLKSFEGCIGVKTGFTKKSGRCLVSAAERDGKRVIVVTLKDPNDWRDHAEMLDYGLEKLEPRIFSAAGTDIGIKVLLGEDENVSVSFDDMTFSTLKNNEDKLSFKLLMPSVMAAPIEKGQSVGKAVIYYDGIPIKQTNIYSLETSNALETKSKSVFERVIDYLVLMIKTV